MKYNFQLPVAPFKKFPLIEVNVDGKYTVPLYPLLYQMFELMDVKVDFLKSKGEILRDTADTLEAIL